MPTRMRPAILDEFIPVRVSLTRVYLYSFTDAYGLTHMYTDDSMEMSSINLPPSFTEARNVAVHIIRER